MSMAVIVACSTTANAAWIDDGPREAGPIIGDVISSSQGTAPIDASPAGSTRGGAIADAPRGSQIGATLGSAEGSSLGATQDGSGAGSASSKRIEGAIAGAGVKSSRFSHAGRIAALARSGRSSATASATQTKNAWMRRRCIPSSAFSTLASPPRQW